VKVLVKGCLLLLEDTYIYIYIYIHVHHMKFAAFVYHILSYPVGSIFYHCIYGCMFCMLVFNL
jgi:hypothetical protein